MMIKTKTKMEKLKIVGMSSKSYPEGRIDSFSVPLSDNPNQGIQHKYIMPLFRELGFSEEEVWDLDIDFENRSVGSYFFSYGNTKIKAWLIVEEKILSIKFDTSLPREDIIKVMDKYFQFPED
jgi:hypothetical protein